MAKATVSYPRTMSFKLTDEDWTKLCDVSRELHVSPSEVMRMLLKQAEILSKPRVFLSQG